MVLALFNLGRAQAARGLLIVCPTTQSLYEMEADGALHVELGHKAAVVSCNAFQDCILDNDTILSPFLRPLAWLNSGAEGQILRSTIEIHGTHI